MLKIFWKIEDFLLNKGMDAAAGKIESIEDIYYKITWTLTTLLKSKGKNVKIILKLGGWL